MSQPEEKNPIAERGSSKWAQTAVQEIILRLPIAQQIKTLQTIASQLAESFQDDALVDLLETLVLLRPLETPRREHLVRKSKRVEGIRELIDFYWKLPDKRQQGMHYCDSARDHVPTMIDCLMKTKMWIIEQVSFIWEEPLTEANLAIFKFLTDAFTGTPGEHRRSVSKEQKETILKAIRRRFEYANVADIEAWFEHAQTARPIMNEFLECLMMARAKRGGLNLVIRDRAYAKLLADYDPVERSDAAHQLFHRQMVAVVELDKAVKELTTAMKAGFSWKAKEIGQSDFVSGKIRTDFLDVDEVSMTVELEGDNFDEALGVDIYHRAVKHIETWHPKNAYICLRLTVVGNGTKGHIEHQKDFRSPKKTVRS